MASCTLKLPDKLLLPQICVVCGGTATESVSYDQDNAPLIGGGFAVMTWRRVAFPYCADHAEQFKVRTRMLRIFQYLCAIPGIIILLFTYMIYNPQIGSILNMQITLSKGSVTWLIIIGFALLMVPAPTLFLKSFIYDARIDVFKTTIRVKAISDAFIAKLIELNDKKG